MERSVVSRDKTSGRRANDARTTATVESLFNQIVESETFKGAPVSRGLLLYLWRHQGESISEFGIAVEALGRSADFDPKVDSTVRVAVGRLRTKLKEFYDRETESSPLQLVIPLGGHEIRWVQGLQPPSHLSIFRDLPLLYRSVLVGSIGLATVLAVACITLILQNRTLKAPLPAPEIPRLWRSFLASGKSPIIVVPSPLFFEWFGKSIVMIRDVGVSQFQDWATSPFIQQVAGQWGPPKLAQVYIPVEAMTSAARIQKYLESIGQHPELRASSNLAAGSVSSENTIFLGPTSTYLQGDHVKQIMEKTNFYEQSTQPSVVGNRNPLPGEAAEYREVEFSATHRMVPGLLFLLPASSNGARSLLLIGRNTAAFTSLLLTPDGLKLLDDQWRKVGSPDSWEMVFQAEINGDTVLRFQPLAIHKIAPALFK